ncbi:MAG TPA: glycoside hydrolase family 3 N-terminal domain-containing protein, partial [Candidatus Krumholzibacterium sp.]|nr:glycoside hydrolase family 3 N-terminal domain-containing protein [Candidatus Krumholzibacterium sp.]
MNAFEKTVQTLARHIVVGLRSTRLDELESGILRKYLPAGVIIFARNVESASGLQSLTAEISSIYEKAGALPPLIMADHEGGRTSVLARAIGTPPSQMAAAMSCRTGAVGELFRETAARMLACGVNMSLGPVADINSEYLNPVIGTRAFGMSEEMVSALVSEAVEAMKSTGILTSIKHFPGHGSTAGDSHVELPVTAKNMGQLRIKDL